MLHSMKLKSFYVPLCLLVLSVMTNTVSANPNSNKEYVHKLWKQNGVDVLLDNTLASLYSGERDLLGGLDPDNKQKIKAIVDDNHARLKEHMLKYMEKHGRSTLLVKAIKWLNTPLGKKISKLNIVPQSLYTDPESGIPVKEPDISPERMALKKKFETIMYSPNSGFMTSTLEHYMILQNHTRQPNQRMQSAQLQEQIKLAKVKVRNVIPQIMPHVYYRNYNDLSLEEVTVLLNYLDSDAGRGFNDLLLEAYIDGLNTTRPDALLSLSKLFEDELSVLSPYSKKTISSAQERQLMALLVKQHGKPRIIRAMLEARNGEMTIMHKGEEKDVYGRPNQKLVTLDTLMKDLGKSGKDIREFYKILQKHL